MRILLENRASLDIRDKHSLTALLYAVSGGNVDIAQLMLRAYLDYKNADAAKKEAFLRAAYWGHSEIVSLLLYNNASVDCGDSFNDTALMYAVNNDKKESVRLLVLAGSRYDVVNSSGETAWGNASEEMKDVIAEAERECLFLGSEYAHAVMHALEIEVGESCKRLPRQVRGLVVEYVALPFSPEDRERYRREELLEPLEIQSVGKSDCGEGEEGKEEEETDVPE